MSSDTFSLLFPFLLILVVIIGFVRLSTGAIRHGDSRFTTKNETTYEILSKDNRSIIERNVEVKANFIVEE